MALKDELEAALVEMPAYQRDNMCASLAALAGNFSRDPEISDPKRWFTSTANLAVMVGLRENRNAQQWVIGRVREAKDVGPWTSAIAIDWVLSNLPPNPTAVQWKRAIDDLNGMLPLAQNTFIESWYGRAPDPSRLTVTQANAVLTEPRCMPPAIIRAAQLRLAKSSPPVLPVSELASREGWNSD